MVENERPGPNSNPEDFEAREVSQALKDRELAFRRRQIQFFNDSTPAPPENPDNPAAESPFTTTVSGTERQAVEKVHQSRSKAAQIADESYNAKTTTDTSKWASDPSRYDYPGVDTVAPRYQHERAEELSEFAEKEGIVEDISVEENVEFKGNSAAGVAQSKAGGGTAVKIREDVKDGQNKDPRFDFSPVLTHEVGHAIDFGAGQSFSDHLERPDNEEQRDEAVTVSKMMRGVFDDASEQRKEYRSGQGEGSRELAADFIASRAIQPRATERVAPELTEEFDDEFEDEFGAKFSSIF